jgi:hypothetical protein
VHGADRIQNRRLDTVAVPADSYPDRRPRRSPLTGYTRAWQTVHQTRPMVMNRTGTAAFSGSIVTGPRYAGLPVYRPRRRWARGSGETWPASIRGPAAFRSAGGRLQAARTSLGVTSEHLDATNARERRIVVTVHRDSGRLRRLGFLACAGRLNGPNLVEGSSFSGGRRWASPSRSRPEYESGLPPGESGRAWGPEPPECMSEQAGPASQLASGRSATTRVREEADGAPALAGRVVARVALH